ncbi:MAG: hypothetical protein H0V61_05245, partial [Chitinophagales bacterium]|nr:hypothetical protein [Chitinophagales bacterium]
MKSNITFSSLIIFLFFNSIALAQSGSLDPSFADSGIFKYDSYVWQELPVAFTVTPDGKMLFVDSHNNLIRYLPAGTPDTLFGANGIGLNFYNDFFPSALAIDSSNRIVVAGHRIVIAGPSYTKVVVQRYLEDGTKDLSFGEQGDVFLSLDNTNQTLIIQPDGKIVIAGKKNSDVKVFRLNDDGSTDFTFNQAGYIGFLLNTISFPFGIDIQPDG